MKRLEGN